MALVNFFRFSTLLLFVRQGHPACKNTWRNLATVQCTLFTVALRLHLSIPLKPVICGGLFLLLALLSMQKAIVVDYLWITLICSIFCSCFVSVL